MNWWKHIFRRHQKDDAALGSLMKELFDKLSVFAQNEPAFALGELGSREAGLNDQEVKDRIKIWGLNTIADEKKTNHFLIK